MSDNFRKFLVTIGLVKEIDREIAKEWLIDSREDVSFLHVSEIEKPSVVFAHMISEKDISKLFSAELHFNNVIFPPSYEIQIPLELTPFVVQINVKEILSSSNDW